MKAHAVVRRSPEQALSLIPWLIGALSVLFTLAMFRGLEAHSGYEGNAYQAIHPESFPNDPFMAITRPMMWSVLYRVVRLVGDIWLDDRFTIVIFAGIAAVTLLIVDTTVRFLGARTTGERAAMLSMMLLGHQILGNGGALVSHFDFNHGTFSGPVILWLLYACLAGSSLKLVLPLLIFSPLLSVKQSAMPVLITLIFLWRERLGPRGKWIAGIGAGIAVVVLVVTYYAFIRPPGGGHAWLFDQMRQQGAEESNPFRSPLINNLQFIALCFGGLMIHGLESSVRSRVRIIAGLGLAVWLLGSLYVSFAPDLIKVPYVEAFNVSRLLWWPQYVLYVVLGVALVKKVQHATSGIGLGVAWAPFMVLYFLHTEFHVKLAAVVAAVTVSMLWGYRRIWAQTGRWNLLRLSPAQRVQILATAACIGTLSLYAVGTVSHRLSDLRYLMRYGIVGSNSGAKWVGVNEYIREHTPTSATFLALSWHGAGDTRELQCDLWLRSRTGRSMRFGSPIALLFDYRKIQWWERQAATLASLLQAWEHRNEPEVARQLSTWGAPDYLVVPVGEAEWLRAYPQFAYVTETTLGQFTILRKRSLPAHHT